MTHFTKKCYSWPATLYSSLLIVMIAAISILASVPPVSRDALIHHLTIPKLYLQHGGMYEIPELFFSYFPMNLDLLYLISLVYNNDILPKFIHFTFALITAWLIFCYLKRRINTEYALLGCLFFLSIPIIVYQSTIIYVDLGLVCFLFASLITLFKWIEKDFKIKYLLISAFLCGLALGTKYNGLIGLLLLGLFVPFVYSRYHSGRPYYARKTIAYSAIFVAVALMVFSPWMIRNMIWTGNPVYPLYNSIFNPETESNELIDEDEPEKRSGMSHFQIRRDIYGESGWEIALIPLRVFFQGRDNDPKYFDGRANPFLLLLPIFAFLGIRANTRQVRSEKIMMLVFSVLFLLYACAQTVIRIRYFAPILPPLVVLSLFGLFNIQEHLHKRKNTISGFVRRITIFIIIFSMLFLNAKYIIERYNYVQPWGYINGKVSRDEYIQKFHPEYATMQYANKHLTGNDRILCIYTGNRGYYLDIDKIFSLNLLQDLAAKARIPEDIAEGLRENDISHLLVNYEMFNFWVQNYSHREKQMLKDFFEKWTVTEFSKDSNGLLRILSGS